MNLDSIFLNQPIDQKPIDIVYTFVDPSDKDWQKKYYTYNKKIDTTRFDFLSEQICFSLKTIEKYMSWINKIYIVTDNQKFKTQSEFLKNKVIWVDHKDIIPDNFLPTFNSMTIESFLWKIDGLSDFFLYMNDDIFLGNNVKYNDLIDDDTNQPIQFYCKCKYYNHPWIRNIQNTNNFFRIMYSLEYDICPQHAPHFIQKDIFQTTYEIFHSFLTKMYTLDRVRSYNEYAHNLLFLYAMYTTHKKLAINQRTSFSPLFSLTEQTINKMKNKQNRKKFYCFFSPVRNINQRQLYKELQQIVLQ
jgi:hypothetical protein